MKQLFRCAIIGFMVWGGFWEPQSARGNDTVISLVSTEAGGMYERSGDTMAGAFPIFFNEAAKRSGATIDYLAYPWSRAMKVTESSDNILMFPMTRTPSRENRFTWVALLKEDQMCFVSFANKVDRLDAAKLLERIIVWRDTSSQEFLEHHGFRNLILVGNIETVRRILSKSPDAVWYFTCDEAQTFIGQEHILVKGDPVASEEMWLAGGRSFVRTPKLDAFIRSIAKLRSERYLLRLLSENK